MSSRPLLLVSTVLALSAVCTTADARTTPNLEGRVVRDPHTFEWVAGSPAPIQTASDSDTGGASKLGGGTPVPLPAGAVQIDETYYDLQDMGTLGTHIATNAAGEIHVTYQDGFCELDDATTCPPDLGDPLPFPYRANAHTYRTAEGTWVQLGRAEDPSLRGCCVTELFGGFGSLAMTPDGRAAVAQHMNEDGCDLRASLYVQETPGVASYDAYLSPITDPSYLFPQGVFRPDGSMVLLGEVAAFGLYQEVAEIHVSRLAGEGVPFDCPVGWQFDDWSLVIDPSVFTDGASGFPSMAASDDGSVGIAVGDFGGDVRLIESSDGSFAAGTITITNLTNYDDADITVGDESSMEYRSYVHCHLAYNGDVPHVVWDELQARREDGEVFYYDYRSRIMHWTPATGVTQVHRVPAGVADTYDDVDAGGSGPLAGFNTLAASWPQVGFSDSGDVTYVAWLRFSDDEVDPTADAGLPGIVTGIGFGDIEASWSTEGSSWSSAENLTNTPETDERFFAIPRYSLGTKLSMVFQASSTDRAGTVIIGDRGAEEVALERRLAYLESELTGVSSTPNGAIEVSSERAFIQGVFPNPSTGGFSVRLSRVLLEPTDAEILDVGGRVLGRFSIPANVDEFPLSAAAEDVVPRSSGTYFVRIHGEDQDPVRVVIVR